MKSNAPKTPSIEEFREFSFYTSKLPAPKPHIDGLLSPRETQTPSAQGKELYELCRKHVVFQWMLSQDEFKTAVGKLWKKSSFKARKESKLYNFLRVAGQISLAFSNFQHNLENSDTLQIVTKKYRKQTLKPIQELLDRIDNGVTLLFQSDTNNLNNLLKKLQNEIKKKTPSIYPNTKSEFIPERILVQQIALDFYLDYEEYMPTVVEEIVKMITPSISLRQIERYIKITREIVKETERANAINNVTTALLKKELR